MLGRRSFMQFLGLAPVIAPTVAQSVIHPEPTTGAATPDMFWQNKEYAIGQGINAFDATSSLRQMRENLLDAYERDKHDYLDHSTAGRKRYLDGDLRAYKSLAWHTKVRLQKERDVQRNEYRNRVQLEKKLEVIDLALKGELPAREVLSHFNNSIFGSTNYGWLIKKLAKQRVKDAQV